MRNGTLSVVAALSVSVVCVACTGDSPLSPRSLTPGAASHSNGTSHYSIPFTFEIPAGACGLKTTVDGSGEYDFVETVTPKTSNGTRTIAISNVHAHGSAAGADGTRYLFNYENNLRYIELPPGDMVFTFVDRFNLVGQGSAPNIGVTVQAAFTIHEDGTSTFTIVQRNGDFTCDPI
jgi:hypothetical protein